MPEPGPTEIGRVRHVLGARITVALDPGLAGVAPIYRGRLQAVAQVGSLVRIPQGLVDLIGQVSLVGISELSGALPPSEMVQTGDRWLQVQLLGQVDGVGNFQRGVSTYPGLDDPVHFATQDLLTAVFPSPGKAHVEFAVLSAAPEIPVSLDAQRLILRHAAVVGSTGAGKTSAVASLLQAFVSGGWPGANVVVIDPHGEYSAAIGGAGSVRSVLGNGASAVRVPYWALPADELLRAFTGTAAGGGTTKRFQEIVTDLRREFVEEASWLTLDSAAVTADTPVPFDVHEAWYRLDRENRTTLRTKGDPTSEALVHEGDPQSLTPAQFEPYGPAGAPPFKSGIYDAYGRVPELLRLGLQDPRLRFLREPRGDPAGTDPLEEIVLEWLGQERPISVLDFGGVSSEVADLAIGVVVDLLFEIALRSEEEGIGRPCPVLLVLEEAHRYLGESANPVTRRAVNRIAREGRKYGIGLMLVTQRPSELPDTALAQCGTLIALRLTNASDQGRVRAALPDATAGLAEALPALRTHEAIISGEAITIPVRTLVRPPNPWPHAQDPSLEPWRSPSGIPNIAPALAAWRGAFETTTD